MSAWVKRRSTGSGTTNHSAILTPWGAVGRVIAMLQRSAMPANHDIFGWCSDFKFSLPPLIIIPHLHRNTEKSIVLTYLALLSCTSAISHIGSSRCEPPRMNAKDVVAPGRFSRSRRPTRLILDHQLRHDLFLGFTFPPQI